MAEQTTLFRLDGRTAARRATRRAAVNHKARLDRAPQTIPGFRHIVAAYVLDRLLAGLEPTEDGLLAAQQRVYDDLDDHQRTDVSIVGLDHPKTGPAIDSAIGAYLTKVRIREAKRRHGRAETRNPRRCTHDGPS